MRRVLLLTSVMKRGFGVSVVAAELARRLEPLGWEMHVGALEADDTFPGVRVAEIDDDITDINTYCQDHAIDVIVAQTSPYFEKMPILDHWYRTMVYEHGDPTPELIAHERYPRRRGTQYKTQHVYPYVSRVVAISDFIRSDIRWPAATVIPNGCDHVPDRGPKADATLTAGAERPLRVGTLMRLGRGEALYKGVDEFAALVAEYAGDDRFRFAIMGRGEETDRARWESLGVECHLNATDEERAEYLRDLDVFLSPSLWEGFNLPLVEAQASGTVGVAYDTGAHPETTPFVVASRADLETLLEAWSADRALLVAASRRSYEFVRSAFVWDRTARAFAAELDATMGASRAELWRRTAAGRAARKVLGRYRIDGFMGIAKAVVIRGARALKRN